MRPGFSLVSTSSNGCTMAREVDLEVFRTKWKEELCQQNSSLDKLPVKFEKSDSSDDLNSSPLLLSQPTNSSCSQKHANFISQLKEEVGDVLYQPFVIVGQLLKEGLHPSNRLQKIQAPREESIKRSYFHSSVENKVEPVCSSKKKTKTESQRRPNFIDCLVADLDEINEIPFFEITLAREVALKIFQYLDYRDLCRCAQVSKSWRSLADDDWLWYSLYCQKLGSPLAMGEKGNWKWFIKEESERHRMLLTNWKGHLGQLKSLRYVQGGVLCAAACHNSTVVAGFTNGQVKLWNLDNEDECIFNPSDMSLVIDESAEEGTVANAITHLVTGNSLTFAAFRHGFVDVWLNEGSLSPFHTIHCGKRITTMSLLEMSREALFAVVYGPYLQLETVNKKTEDDPSVTQLCKIDFNSKISAMKFVPDTSAIIPADCALAVATEHTVQVHNVGQSPDHLTEIHNMYGTPITCMDISKHKQMAIGLGSSTGLFDGYQLKLYEMDSGKLLSTFQGHTWYITCVHLNSGPSSFTIATGCADRKVRLYDSRRNYPVMSFAGHTQKISALQMDDWKIVSGCEDGIVTVWDQRMATRLWDWHNRHPVRLCHYDDQYLIVANVPEEKFFCNDDFVADRKHRGTLQVYDFLCDQTLVGKLPDICQSSYDQPHGYDYSINLTMPYDSI